MRLIYNYFKNHFWIETGVEFFGLASIFVYMQHEFDNPLHDPLSHVIMHFGDPWVVIILSAIAALNIGFGLWDVHWLHARDVIVFISQFTATMIFMGFLWHGFSMPIKSPDALSCTWYSAMVVFRIFNNMIKPTVVLRVGHVKSKGGVKYVK